MEGALGLKEIETKVADDPPPPDDEDDDLPLQAMNAANTAITSSSGRLRFTAFHHKGEAHGYIQPEGRDGLSRTRLICLTLLPPASDGLWQGKEQSWNEEALVRAAYLYFLPRPSSADCIFVLANRRIGPIREPFFA